MRPLAALRRSALVLVVAALVAGCATPPAENRPGDALCDADGDGIRDGGSPVPGANETCPMDETGEPLTNETANPDDNTTPEMPGVI